MEKFSYPNFDSYQEVKNPYDKKKWLATIKDIYYKQHNGISRKEAINQLCSTWQEQEKIDFLSYLAFYESGDHLKYKEAIVTSNNIKIAQNYKSLYQGGPGYFLHVNKDKNESNDEFSGNEINKIKEDISSELTDAEKKEIVARQKKLIIGRLNSAEKILTTPNGQLFAGPEFEFLIKTIQELKLKILKINKISSSTRIYSDMIAKEANVSIVKGFTKAAGILNKIADEIPTAAPPAPPTQQTGAPTTDVKAVPGSSPQPMDSAGNNNTLSVVEESKPEEKEISKGMRDFLKNMGEIDENAADDLIVEAQVAPEEIPPEVKPEALPVQNLPKEEQLTSPENLEVEENPEHDSAADADKQSVNDVNDRFEKALDGITVSDVIAKLENITNIFRTREVPRALAIVDIMLHSLGLASLTPTLAEANSKSLESNNYVLSRLEDLISKLRGAVATENVEIVQNKINVSNPEAEKVKQVLKNDQDKERARKEKRKSQENEDLEVEEDLTPLPEEDLIVEEPVAPAKATPPAPLEV